MAAGARVGEDRALAPCLSCCPDMGWGNEMDPVQLPLFICAWKECLLSSPSSPSEAAPKQVFPEDLQHCMGAAWELLPTPAGQCGDPLSGKMPPSKGDLWICAGREACVGKRCQSWEHKGPSGHSDSPEHDRNVLHPAA